jgi:hypothetical protein
MFRTAQREAWRLTAIHGNERRLSHERPDRDAEDPSGGLDPAWQLERREDLREAVDELKRMPKPMREAVFVHSQVPLHREVADILGVSQNRVAYLLAAAGAEVRDRAVGRVERERPVASPRAARLRELEDDPPEWLIQAAGRPPAKGKNASASILAWRRAALTIDDYRNEHGRTSPHEGLGPQPADNPVARRAYDRALQAIDRLTDERARRGGRGLDR